MICKICNKENAENTKFCVNCGNRLEDNNVTTNQNLNNNTSNNIVNNNMNNNINTEMNNNINTEMNNNIYNNVNSNVNQNNIQPQVTNQLQNDKTNIGLVILSWFIPLAGLIIFIVKKDKEPKTAKASGICALISTILTVLLLIIIFSILFSTAGLIFDAVENGDFEVVEDYEDDYDYGYSDNENDLDKVITGSVDWKNYEISVNNEKLVLPTKYNDIITATGFKIKDADAKSYLSSNYYSLVNMYKDDKLALYIELLNDTDGDLIYTDCKVTRVSQTKYQISQGADVITFPGELNAGMEITEDEIINLLGTPYDINEYSSEGYESKIYTYVEDTTWTTTNNYKITVVNGVIDEISLDNR